MGRCFVIAEAGVNHNGDFELAKELVIAAKKAGADAVKFQTFKAENLATSFSKKAEYQLKTNVGADTQFAMLKSLELPNDKQLMLFDFARGQGIQILSSPFDVESVDFLATLKQDIFKIPSGEIINYPYLQKIAKLGKKVILSTGMCRLGEVEDAINVLEASGLSRDMLTLLHCNTEYPTPMEDVNLRAMVSMGNAFNVKFGYSDHTAGIEIPIAAVALGARVIEKHFTLSSDMEGPDHKASLEPQKLAEMIRGIRNVEIALGDGIKRPTKSETKNIEIARKSLVAKRPIKAGEVFSNDNMIAKRPTGGLNPMLWPNVIGKVAKRDFAVDEFIEL